MQIKQLSLGALGTNCYIVSKDNLALIFDPGGDAHIINKYLLENNLSPLAILLTHAHFDHIGAVHELRKTFDIDVYLHKAEEDWLEKPDLNRSFIYFGEEGAIKSPPPEHVLREGQLEIGPFLMEVVHTPGHSPGSVTFIFRNSCFIVSGDVLFHHGIGRTDLPDGSLSELANSITEKIYSLPDEFIVYPGHGEQTSIGYEKMANPYTLQFYQN